MEFTSMNRQCAGEAAALWNRCVAAEYHVTEEMLTHRFFDDPDVFLPGSFVCRENGRLIGFIASKISDNTLPEYQHAGWLSLLAVDGGFRRRGVGAGLYRAAEEAFRRAGVAEIIVGGEMRCFVSGIPQPDEASTGFFRAMDFTLNDCEHYDLQNDLSQTDLDAFNVRRNTDSRYRTVPARGEDAPVLAEFMRREFPGRWELEVMQCLQSSGDHVLLFRDGGQIEGFCHVCLESGTDGAASYLGSNAGGLGPIGIAKSIRGKGLGTRILYDSLKYLQEIGAHRTNIDWTILKDYYGAFGFTPWRTYLAACKDLSVSVPPKPEDRPPYLP